MFKSRYALIPLAILATCGAASPVNALDRSVFTCTNPTSGATWQIHIDYDRAVVDSNPARISETAISWRDARDGWNCTLDRKTGELTVIVASSTGGYFLHAMCRLPP